VSTLLRNEWLRLRSTRWPWLLVIIPQLVIVYGAVQVIISSGHDAEHPEQVAAAAAHVGLVSVFVLVLGIVGMTSEYRDRTGGTSRLARPECRRVVLGKLAFYAIAGVVFGLIGTVIVLITLSVAMPARGFSVPIGNPNLWLSLLGSVLWDALFAVLGVAIGVLIRNPWVPVIASLVFLYLIEGGIAQIANAFSFWLPFAAGESLARVPETDGLPPWGAGLLLAGYVIVFTALAIRVTDRRAVAS
jgi:ABC-2 type transport system permease protein